jgi:hypothetical protein
MCRGVFRLHARRNHRCNEEEMNTMKKTVTTGVVIAAGVALLLNLKDQREQQHLEQENPPCEQTTSSVSYPINSNVVIRDAGINM